MARPKSLTKMSLDALIELRDTVTSTISEQAAELQRQLARITGTGVGKGAKRGRKPGRAKGSKLKGRKVAAKYRSKKDPKLPGVGSARCSPVSRQPLRGRAGPARRSF